MDEGPRYAEGLSTTVRTTWELPLQVRRGENPLGDFQVINLSLLRSNDEAGVDECEDYIKRWKTLYRSSALELHSVFKKKTTYDYFLIFFFSYWYIFKFIKQNTVT